jgi:hypothetical protein
MTHVDDAFPPDGPHTADSVRDAARTVNMVVTYLSYATAHPGTVGDPTNLAIVVGDLHQVAVKLSQVLHQLAGAADRYTTMSGLSDDHGGHPVVTAREVDVRLREAAGAALKLVDPLGAAREAAAHLGVQSAR